MRNEVELDGCADVYGDREDGQAAEELGYKTTITASSPIHLQKGILEIDTHRRSRPSVSRTTSQVIRSPPRPPEQALQIQSTNDIASRQGPIESEIWDWQASSPDVRAHFESSLASNTSRAYSYEAQGELLLQDSIPQGAEEFQIPNPVLSPNISRNPLETLLADSKSSTRNRGVKRKSAPELFALSPLEFGTAKRSAIDLGEDRPAEFERRIIPPSHVSAPPTYMALPARKVFPIQIGDKLFRLSGASINSDGK